MVKLTSEDQSVVVLLHWITAWSRWTIHYINHVLFHLFLQAVYFSKVQLVMWLPLSRISSKGKQILGLIFFRIFQSDLKEKNPGKPLKFTGKSRENWVNFWAHSKWYLKQIDMNYYTVTSKSFTFHFFAILF